MQRRLVGLSGFVLLGLAGLRRAAAAGEITASGAGLSLDIGVNGQVGGRCGAAPGAAEGARIERNLGGLAGGWSQQTRRQRRGAGGGKHCQVNLVLSGS